MVNNKNELQILIRSSLNKKSGYQDSNLGPPAPKAGTLTGLRYTPCYGKKIIIKKIISFFNRHYILYQNIFSKKIELNFPFLQMGLQIYNF